MSEYKVAVLIPCRNEAGSIQNVIQNIEAIAPDYKIIVCDNASSDDTADVANRLGVVVVSEPKPGKGSAMTALFLSVDADCYIMCDGDDTYDVSNIQNMADLILGGYDFVTADRELVSGSSGNITRAHKIGNVFIDWLADRLYGPGISDILSGYRAMSRRFVKSLPKLRGGFTIETELSIFALKNKFRITEMPVPYKRRTSGKSKITIKDGLEIIWLLLFSKVKK